MSSGCPLQSVIRVPCPCSSPSRQVCCPSVCPLALNCPAAAPHPTPPSGLLCTDTCRGRACFSIPLSCPRQGRVIKLREALSSCWLHCAAWPGPLDLQHEETWCTEGATGGHRPGSVSGFCFDSCPTCCHVFEVQSGDLPWKCGPHCIQNSSNLCCNLVLLLFDILI